MPELVEFDQLCKWSGYTRPSDVRKWLDLHGIAMLPAKGNEPVTTLTAINNRLAGTQAGQQPSNADEQF